MSVRPKLTTTLALLIGAIYCGGTAQSAHAFQPQTISEGSYQITVDDVRWEAVSNLSPGVFGPHNTHRAGDLALVVWYDLSPQTFEMNNGMKLPFTNAPASLLLPDGTEVTGIAARDDSILPGHEVVLFNDIDPRTPSYTVRFRFVEPHPPQGFDGRSRETVSFTNVPAPTPGQAPIPLALSQSTAGGLKVLLDGIAIRQPQGPSGTPHLAVLCRWQPPDSAPDTSVDFAYPLQRFAPQSIVGDTGESLTEPQITPGNWTDIREVQAGRFTLAADPPATQPKSYTVNVTLNEIWPSRMDPSAYLSFAFPLAAGDVAMPAPIPDQTVKTPLATQEFDASSSLTLLRITTAWTRSMGLTYSAELMLQEPVSPAARSSDWTSDSAGYIFEDASGTGGATLLSEGGYWFDDHTSIAPGQHLYLLLMRVPANQLAAPTGSVTIKLHWRHLETQFDQAVFRRVPIPSVGTISISSPTASTRLFGAVKLSEIGYFNEQQPLSSNYQLALNCFQPPAGLAITAEPAPDTSSPTCRFSTSIADAMDDHGRSLVRTQDLRFPGPIWPPLKGPVEPLTVYLFPPTTGSRTFDLTLNVTKTSLLGETTTVFKDVPMPPRPAPPDQGP